MSQWHFVTGSSLCIPMPECLTAQEIAMSHLESRLLAAVAVGLVAAGFGAQAADLRSERYALIDPGVYSYATPKLPTPVAKVGTAGITKKKAKPEKAKILTGLQNYRTPAQRALDRIRVSASPCQPIGAVCLTGFHEGTAKSQSWQYAKGQLPDTEAGLPASGMPINGEPALVRPFTDVPGFVPGRESIYRLTLNVPVGRYENVQLQANVRRNAYNTADSSDSTLRADWSLRF
jgi:hypothetical protein